MPQILDPQTKRLHRLCPVRSFENYIFHLNPKIPYLWQQPQKLIPAKTGDPWYKAQRFGHNPLDNFMAKLSANAYLSQRYTNHCIRVTGVTNLIRQNYSPKQVMSVTGHKSLQSLALYQQVKADEKLAMGMSLMYSLLKPEDANHLRSIAPNDDDVPALPMPVEAPPQMQNPTPPPAIEAGNELLPLQPHALDPANNILPLQNALVPVSSGRSHNDDRNDDTNTNKENDILDIDLLEFLADNNGDNEIMMAANQMESMLAKSNTTIVKKSGTKPTSQPTFNNCTFGNIGVINIHIHKH